MTFKEFMKEVGYDPMTTFWEDFSIADKYGIGPVPRAARASRGTWTSPLVARTTVTSTTVAGFGR
jgi:hypothetical protein